MSRNFNQELNRKLWRTGKLSDIKIIVEDAKFNVHKTILAASCPYFETLLYGNTKESKMNEITLKQTPKLIFAYLLEFIYVGQLDANSISENDEISLLRLAHEYQFDELFDFIISHIEINSLKLSNVAQLLVMFSAYQMNDLKERCLLLFDEKSEEVLKQKDLFAAFPPKLVCDVISRDTFYANEIDIFKCLLLWSQSFGGDKSVFNHVRWNLISINDYMKIVKPTMAFDSDKYLTAVHENQYSQRFCKPLVNCSCTSKKIEILELTESNEATQHQFDSTIANENSCDEVNVLKFESFGIQQQCESEIYTYEKYEDSEDEENNLDTIDEEN
ncbi:BTB/POZ domain-containing protein 9-like protein [Leptotrombidium deliense]|uniref:BTB/POZ domain-containing protein 9-like protein n=1 Tax=Leptotrombidium deliense TaxID=299467 RepID=A0A443SB42_9ACAR|nr:BTB/POZ domain-containing protein 9-like protein [Leptotrombidium deliense]